MELDTWTQSIDSSGAWLCEHTDWSGNSAPSTRLTVASAEVENPNAPPYRRRAFLYCADCGTLWRVWKKRQIAKYYVTPPIRSPLSPASPLAPPYRRALLRDIDKIITLVLQRFPEMEVMQQQASFPADDDGLWFFHLPGFEEDLQMESPFGMCPFFVENNDFWGENGRTVETIEEVVLLLTDHFSPS